MLHPPTHPKVMDLLAHIEELQEGRAGQPPPAGASPASLVDYEAAGGAVGGAPAAGGRPGAGSADTPPHAGGGATAAMSDHLALVALREEALRTQDQAARLAIQASCGIRKEHLTKSRFLMQITCIPAVCVLP